MARGSLNIFELHAEKLLLGLVGAFTLYMVAKFFVLNPNTVDFGGDKVGPSEIRQKILDKARTLETRLKSAQPQPQPVPKLADKVGSVLSTGVLAPSAEGQPALPSAIVLATPFGEDPPNFEQDDLAQKVSLIKPLAPRGAATTAGRALVTAVKPSIAASNKQADDRAAAGEGKEVAYVSVAAWFPNVAQESEMLNAGYPPFRAKVFISGIEAQRQELLADGEWSDWTDVTLSGAMPDYNAPTPAVDDSGAVLNRGDLDEAYKTIKAAQLQITQPKFYPVKAGDFWRLPPLEGVNLELLATKTDLPEARPQPTATDPQPTGTAEPPADPNTQPPGGRAGRRNEPSGEPPKKTARERNKEHAEKLKAAEAAYAEQKYEEVITAAKAVLADTPFGEAEKQAQSLLTRANDALFAAKLRTLDKPIMHASNEQTAIWFHDDTVEAGKTYRYRIRVSLWNRFVGRTKDVKAADEAKLAVLPGEWSLPTQPVTVRPAVAYFLANAALSEGRARVDVYKWRAGTWITNRFDVAIGDVIGGPKKVGDETLDFSTGAVVLDIADAPDFAARNRKTKDGQFEYRKSANLLLTYLDPLDGRVKQMHYDKYDPIAEPIREAAQ